MGRPHVSSAAESSRAAGLVTDSERYVLPREAILLSAECAPDGAVCFGYHDDRAGVYCVEE